MPTSYVDELTMFRLQTWPSDQCNKDGEINKLAVGQHSSTDRWGCQVRLLKCRKNDKFRVEHYMSTDPKCIINKYNRYVDTVTNGTYSNADYQNVIYMQEAFTSEIQISEPCKTDTDSFETDPVIAGAFQNVNLTEVAIDDTTTFYLYGNASDYQEGCEAAGGSFEELTLEATCYGYNSTGNQTVEELSLAVVNRPR